MAESAASPASVEVGDPETESRRLQNEKLQLEIDVLRGARRRERFVVWLPLLSTLVAVGGLSLTLNQFFAQQNKDRLERTEQQRVRDEAQIRADLDQLLNVSKSGAASARIIFLFEDLGRLTDRLTAERARATHVIVDFILHDADFDNTNDIRLETAALKHWDEYRRYLRENRSDYEFVFYKYFQGLRHLHDANSKYFETIQYDQTSGYKVSSFADEPLYLRFLALVQGFTAHWNLLKDDAGLRKLAIQRFESALKNTVLTQQLFAIDAMGPSTPAQR